MHFTSSSTFTCYSLWMRRNHKQQQNEYVIVHTVAAVLFRACASFTWIGWHAENYALLLCCSTFYPLPVNFDNLPMQSQVSKWCLLQMSGPLALSFVPNLTLPLELPNWNCNFRGDVAGPDKGINFSLKDSHPVSVLEPVQDKLWFWSFCPGPISCISIHILC